MINPEEANIRDSRRYGIIDKEREEEFLKNYGYNPMKHEGRIK